MKKLLIVLLAIFYTSNIQAQNNIQEAIDRQYIDASHKAFIYQVSPDNRISDEWLINLRKESDKVALRKPVQDIIEAQDLAGVTSFSFTEYKGYKDTMFVPREYTMSSSSGTTESYASHYDTYIWFADSAKWYPQRLQATYKDDADGDSTIVLYYQNRETLPYSGSKIYYPKVITEGADYEYFSDNYDPVKGWEKRERGLSYRNENGQDTLSKRFAYNAEKEEYEISSLSRYIEEENYALGYNEYYDLGVIYSSSKQEQTSTFNLSEKKYYDYEGEVSRWSWSYTKKEANNRYIYQVSKQYDSNLKQLVGTDSLHFIYSNNDKLVEAIGYSWLDSTWVMSQAYNSYQHTLANEKVVVDSVVIYKVTYNAETNTGELDGVTSRTEMDYDVHGNQIEVRNFTTSSTGGTSLHSKIVREFRELSPGYFTQVKQWSYGKEYGSDVLYKASVYEYYYNSEGVYGGNGNFNFNAAGDTTYGYSNKNEILLDGSTGTTNLTWDNTLKKLVLKSFYNYGIKSTNDKEQHYTQTTYRSFYNEDESINRTINVYNKYLGVFNDGPIVAEIGDTVSLYVSARNYDLTVPEIEVTNMPASATYNPETRHFFWIVDDASPSPMTYKAIDGTKFVTTEVRFRSVQFGVGTEPMEAPSGFELSQNFPNPFNPTTNIQFTLQQAGTVSLKVFNMLGQEVATLVNGRIGAGIQTVQFDASNLASGVYLYRLHAGNKIQTNKMMLIK